LPRIVILGNKINKYTLFCIWWDPPRGSDFQLFWAI